MRRIPLLILLPTLLFITQNMWATSSRAQTNAKKDAGALASVEAAMAAMGGDVTWAAIKDSVVTGSVTPIKGSYTVPATFVWKTYAGEFRYETTTSSSTEVFVSGFGKPALERDGKVKALFYQVSQGAPPFYFPAIVLSAKVPDPTYSLIDAGLKDYGGKSAQQVLTSANNTNEIAAITTQTWYIDATTGLPLRVEYRVPSTTSILDWITAATDFSDFKDVGGGMMVPFTMTYYEDGVALQVTSLGTVAFNVGLDPAEFDLLGGGK